MDLFNIPEYTVRKAQKLGASHVVVSAGRTDSQQVKFVNNEIAITKNWQSEDAGVFLAYDKRIVTSNIKTFTKQEVDKTLARLIKLAKLIQPKEDFHGIAQGSSRYKRIPGLYDRKLVNYTKSIDVVQSAINAALKRGAKRVTGVFETTSDESYSVSSHGLRAMDKGTGISLSVRALVDKDATGHQAAQANVLDGIRPANVGLKAGTIAKNACNPGQISPGKYDILFYPMPASDLLGGVAGAGSIDAVENGMSFLSKVGQVVGSPKLTIYDWGNMPYGIDSFAFDEEGSPSQKTPVIANGIFKNYLHNFSTAKKYATKTTGNAGLASPSPSNTYIVPGKSSQKSMIESMKKGLIVTNTWYTTYQNYINGDFSTIPRDAIFYVENGQIKNPVKGIRISDNILNLLKNISAVGRDSEQQASWAAEPPNFQNNIVTPSILCKNLTVTKSKT